MSLLLTFKVGYLLCVQSGSTQQELSVNASAIGNVSNYATSETGNHFVATAAAQGIVNYDVPAGHMSFMRTQSTVTPSEQPATADVCEHQTDLG